MHPRSFGLKKKTERPAGRHRATVLADAPGLALGTIALLAPLLLLPGLAWGAAGRRRPAWYPDGWLAAAHMIDGSRAPGDVLLLPWAADRAPSWNHGEVMLDAWPRLVSRPVIWNDGTQVGNVSNDGTQVGNVWNDWTQAGNITMAPDDPRARRLDGLIRSGAPLTAALRAAGVSFVVIDADTPAGARLPGCTAIYNQPDLVVYQVPR